MESTKKVACLLLSAFAFFGCQGISNKLGGIAQHSITANEKTGEKIVKVSNFFIEHDIKIQPSWSSKKPDIVELNVHIPGPRQLRELKFFVDGKEAFRQASSTASRHDQQQGPIGQGSVMVGPSTVLPSGSVVLGSVTTVGQTVVRTFSWNKFTVPLPVIDSMIASKRMEMVVITLDSTLSAKEFPGRSFSMFYDTMRKFRSDIDGVISGKKCTH